MMQSMIFAAGLGTRLKPLTDHTPKALIEIGGQTLLEHTIMRLKEAGFERIVINVHHFATQIVDFLACNNYFGMDIRISDETGQLLDTGGGLKKAAHLFDSQYPVLIHNVDILNNIDLHAFYHDALNKGHGACPDAVLMVSNRKTSRYLLFNDDMRLVGWTNTETGEVRSPYTNLDINTCQRLAFSGIHCFSPHLFKEMETWNGKFGIMDFYLRICDRVCIKGKEWDGSQIMDVGKVASLEEANVFCKQLKDDRLHQGIME
ncbi:MAG: nucleotidyltransferase family protein [Prevotella sp.]|nr:nucleotidyltransferase family protein [Prevotella sp.]